MTHKLPLVLAILVVASLAAACSSKSVLNQHQLHTLLQCPCPTLAPQATYPIPSANTYLGGITTGADHNVWITEGDADKIARITESGTVTEYPVEAGGYPALIEPGPDGNLWFTDYTLNTIHRITTSGAITDFPLPPYDLTNGNLQGIAAGPDGNMWFAHNGANLIGVMSTSGTLLTTYQVPTPNSGVDFIVRGSDGNMWFGESGMPTNCVFKIGRITMSGVITEFPIPTPACNEPTDAIGGMTLGTDGNVWFTERFNAKIGRITPNGIITEFPVPANPGTETVVRIVSTADGSLWFTHNQEAPPWNTQVGQMDLTGTVINLWSYPQGKMGGAAVGPDGSPWFTDAINDWVLRL